MQPFIITIKKYQDLRGDFYESYKQTSLSDFLFVQDNHSVSKKNVIRGMHYQWDRPMDKLVRCSYGKIMDVIVDIRKESETFGKVYYYELSEENMNQLFVPAGFAHGFVALSDIAHVQYKCTAEYNKNGEAGINPLDKTLNINWGIDINEAIISDKDRNSISFLDYKLDPKF
jgi:dTDP-4-dehydrorhamnose 3,5-epimerase